MNYLNFKVLFLTLVLSVISIHFSSLLAQESSKKKRFKELRIGLNYGQASQARFPFNNDNYFYENTYLKGQINYLLREKNKFRLEVNIEPSIYFSEHQLLNPFFIQPSRGDDFLEQRERFTQRKRFNEYALNFGLITRYEFIKNLSGYLLFSVGPMIGTEDTERLRSGFAFSDIFGIGASYRQKKIVFDFRFTLRHSSNANLSRPNNGHNSVGFESGISFFL